MLLMLLMPTLYFFAIDYLRFRHFAAMPLSLLSPLFFSRRFLSLIFAAMPLDFAADYATPFSLHDIFFAYFDCFSLALLPLFAPLPMMPAATLLFRFFFRLFF